MNANDIDATLGYLEFHLLKFVEDMERHVADPDVVGGMYDRAYEILSDFEETFNAQLLLQEVNSAKPKSQT